MIVFKNIFDFRSVFKPFIFVKHAHQLKLTTSPCYGPNDPVKKKPRFQSKPDRRHELFIKHEVVAAAIDSYKVWHLTQACMSTALFNAVTVDIYIKCPVSL